MIRERSQHLTALTIYDSRCDTSSITRHMLIDEIERAILTAGLTTAQQFCIYAHLIERQSFTVIGRGRGITKQGVQHHYLLALAKVQKRIRDDSLRGLREVYRAEVQRGRRVVMSSGNDQRRARRG